MGRLWDGVYAVRIPVFASDAFSWILSYRTAMQSASSLHFHAIDSDGDGAITKFEWCPHKWNWSDIIAYMKTAPTLSLSWLLNH